MRATQTTNQRLPERVGDREVVPVEATPNEWRRMLDNCWFILGLLFCAMGVLGIPLLWVSRGFQWPMKIVLTLLVTLYTAGLVWLAYLSLMKAYAAFQESYSG